MPACQAEAVCTILLMDFDMTWHGNEPTTYRIKRQTCKPLSRPDSVCVIMSLWIVLSGLPLTQDIKIP